MGNQKMKNDQHDTKEYFIWTLNQRFRVEELLPPFHI